jgi:hypothetical protein
MRPIPHARLLLPLALVAALAFDAAAQSAARPLPPGSRPLDEPPPPTIEGNPAPEAKPVVTTRQEGDKEIQEYRIGGKLYMMRVTPKNGPAYVLIDQRGDGQFRQQDTMTPHLAVPQWVIKEF